MFAPKRYFPCFYKSLVDLHSAKNGASTRKNAACVMSFWEAYFCKMSEIKKGWNKCVRVCVMYFVCLFTFHDRWKFLLPPAMAHKALHHLHRVFYRLPDTFIWCFSVWGCKTLSTLCLRSEKRCSQRIRENPDSEMAKLGASYLLMKTEFSICGRATFCLVSFPLYEYMGRRTKQQHLIAVQWNM